LGHPQTEKSAAVEIFIFIGHGHSNQ
jgi:hypothetical protein